MLYLGLGNTLSVSEEAFSVVNVALNKWLTIFILREPETTDEGSCGSW